MNRKKTLIIFTCFYVIIAGVIFFSLRYRSQKVFSEEKFEEIINSRSRFSPKVSDLCQTQLLGEPKVEKAYVKINFYCVDGTKAMSTLALAAFEDKSIDGILNEYENIVNFDEKILENDNWDCKVNSVEIDKNNRTNEITDASTIDCYQK